MEEYKTSELQRQEKGKRDPEILTEQTPRIDEYARSERPLTTREILEMHLRDRSQREARQKWAGRGLIVFGAVLLIGSCPFYALSLAGPATVVAGLALIAAGGALLAWRPRLKPTNEAMLVAMKHGNRLTSTRLALELDVSVKKAERIIQELVRSGTAEIDLDQSDPDHAIIYKIKGL
jgi:hypothetical protein